MPNRKNILSKIYLILGILILSTSSSLYAANPLYTGYAAYGWQNAYKICNSTSMQQAAECGCLAWNPNTAYLCPGKWIGGPQGFQQDSKGAVHCTTGSPTATYNPCRDYGIFGGAGIQCPTGYSVLDNDCVPSGNIFSNKSQENLGKPEYCPVGNPINQGTGNKIEYETDYSSNIPGFNFTRIYNGGWGQRAYLMGSKWRNSFDW